MKLPILIYITSSSIAHLIVPLRRNNLTFDLIAFFSKKDCCLNEYGKNYSTVLLWYRDESSMDHAGHLQTLQFLSQHDLAFHIEATRHFVHESHRIRNCPFELNLKKFRANMILARIWRISGLNYQLCTSEHKISLKYVMYAQHGLLSIDNPALTWPESLVNKAHLIFSKHSQDVKQAKPMVHRESFKPCFSF